MKIIYKNNRVKTICEDIKKATNFFGGKKELAISLMSRINALKQAENIIDIIVQPSMKFHKLNNNGKRNNLKGFFLQ